MICTENRATQSKWCFFDPFLYVNVRLHLNHLLHQIQKLCRHLYRGRCQIWSLWVHMSNRMTKRSSRNAKDTIIKLVMIVRIVATHKLFQFENHQSWHPLSVYFFPFPPSLHSRVRILSAPPRHGAPLCVYSLVHFPPSWASGEQVSKIWVSFKFQFFLTKTIPPRAWKGKGWKGMITRHVGIILTILVILYFSS